MQWKRTATIVAAAGACAAWLAAAATSVRPAGDPRPLPPAPPADSRAATLAVEVARLHGRLVPATTAPEPGRNPFVFVAPRAARPAPVAAAKPALVEAPIAPPPPPLKLAGIAEDAGPDGPQRTAIITTAGQLFLVKEGETVAMRYHVTHITADVVEIVDGVTNSTLRLALR